MFKKFYTPIQMRILTILMLFIGTHSFLIPTPFLGKWIPENFKSCNVEICHDKIIGNYKDCFATMNINSIKDQNTSFQVSLDNLQIVNYPSNLDPLKLATIAMIVFAIQQSGLLLLLSLLDSNMRIEFKTGPYQGKLNFYRLD
jgi:hypothetical protein